MYNISDEAKSLFLKNYRQVVKIKFRGYDREFDITESDILQGGLTVDRYCVSGNKIEIGSAIAGELTLNLDNRDDKFADVKFEGAELEVKIGIKKWDAYKWENAQLHWIPLGFFTVDEQPRKLSNISLTALDRMVRFDVAVEDGRITYPTTIGGLLEQCCDICDVPLGTSVVDLMNATYPVSAQPDIEDLTYRQLIQWIAEITGTCAYVDWNGELRLEWYKSTPTVISKSERYDSDVHEQNITITGVQIEYEEDDENKKVLSGTDDYAFLVAGNMLITQDYQSIADSLNEKLNGFSYLPYSCTCKPFPHVYPLDIITFVDRHGVEHETIVTNTVFTMNSNTSISGKGETNIKNGYAAANPLTKAEAIVLRKLRSRVELDITESEKRSMDLNVMLANSLGLYSTVTKTDSGNHFYYHDKETLDESTIVYTFTANGFAWTNNWDGENSVWDYGITKDGNAILKFLTVNKLTADQIDADGIEAENVKLTGEIKANSGNIGGYDIENGSIKATGNDNTGSYNLYLYTLDSNNTAVVKCEHKSSISSYYSKSATLSPFGFHSESYGSTGNFSATGIQLHNSQNIFLDIVPITGLDKSIDYCTGVVYTTSSTGKKISSISANYGIQYSLDSKYFSGMVSTMGSENGESPTHSRLYLVGSYIDCISNLKEDSAEPTVRAGNFVNTSDLRKKSDIEDISDKYESFFYELQAKTFKYKNDSKTHFGFIAQDVISILEKCGENPKNYAMVGQPLDENDFYSLAYSELIALCVWEIQKLKKQVNSLENELRSKNERNN